MGKKCFILIVLLVFSVPSLLFSNTSGISFDTGAATLYEDGSDSSFLYGAFLSSNSPVGNVDLSFSSFALLRTSVLLPYMADYPFFPFTSLRLEGEGVLHTAFFCSDFTIKKGNFAFDASVALLADVFSRIRASYKYILQKTVVYDGSSAKDSFLNDSCMRDYIALISLKASYDIRIPFFGGGHFISIYAGKKLPLPMISRPTRDFFTGASSDSESSIEYDASGLAKTILFSGLEIGLTLKF